MKHKRNMLRALLEWMDTMESGGRYIDYMEEITAGYRTKNEILRSLDKILICWQRTERKNDEMTEQIKQWRNTIIFMYE